MMIDDKHCPESVRENETYKLFCDFERQTDHLISARRLDLVIVKKKKKEKKRKEKEYLMNSGICCPSGPQSENKRKQKER